MQNLQFCNTGNKLPVVALPPRAAVHTVLAKPMALQPLLAALQTTLLFAIEDSIESMFSVLSYHKIYLLSTEKSEIT
ncbi:MAG: hypothetical protein MRZ94_05560 [Oscillospiraceae bacterium]|nr:hypothetical protein [Oscillospiraceae bacterium]MDY2509543.1 hypothetical protein [Ruminococcus callidus]